MALGAGFGGSRLGVPDDFGRDMICDEAFFTG